LQTYQILNNPKITASPKEHIINSKGRALKPNPSPIATAKGWKMRIDVIRPRIFVKTMLSKKPMIRGSITIPVIRISAVLKIAIISLCQEKFSMQYV
jgi:hypothetical protein